MYASLVPKIRTLLCGVTISPSVRVMLVGLERTATALAAWLENIKLMLGLKRARIVQLGNFQLTSIQQATHALIA